MPLATVAALPNLATGFPQFPDRLIDRPHFLNTLDTMFDGPTQIVVIEGQEGIGKTTLAAQFALGHADHAISVFVSGVSAFSRSPEYIVSTLCDQMHWHFHGTRMPVESNAESYLRTARLRLQRDAGAKGRHFYFIIDGLLQLAAVDSALVSLVLTDYLPVGIPTFRFLLTGDSHSLPPTIREKVPYKPWTPPGFSPDEVKAVLADFQLSAKVLSDISTTFDGVPGKIMSVRRALEGGLSAQALEDNLPRSLADLFTIEWRNVQQDDDLQIRVLATLAHARHEFTLDSLARAVESDAPHVAASVSSLRFIRINPQSGEMSFVSNSFREFAAQRLAQHRSRVHDRIIEVLTAERTTATAVEHLPGYLEATGREKELLTYLTLDHLAIISEGMHSLQPAMRLLRHGFSTSVALGQPASSFRCALHAGLLTEVGAASVLTSEIEARLANNEDELALAIVQGALLKEDRLEGLATIVKSYTARGQTPDGALLTEIRQLAEAVDYSRTPSRAVAIASDLIIALPDVAIALVDKSTKADSEYPADVAYAALTIAAQDLAREQADAGAIQESVSNRIKSPNVRTLARTLSVVVGSYTSDEVLRRADEMRSTRECLYLLERWTSNNADDSEAHKVISYAIGRMLRATDFSLDAKTFRRLATPLPYIAAVHPYEANTILRSIDAQLGMLEKNGPSVDYVRLCMSLAEAEATWNAEGALSRFEQLSYFAANLECELRVEALARIIVALTADVHSRLKPVLATLLSTLQATLSNSIDELLSGTAEHYEVLKRTVRALGSADLALTSDIIDRVNTAERRDALRYACLTSLKPNELQKSNVAQIEGMLSAIWSKGAHDECVADVISTLNIHELEQLAPSWTAILRRSLGIELAPWKAITCAHAQSICARQNATAFSDLTQTFKSATDTAVEAINSDWDRTDVSFTIASVLRASDVQRVRTHIQHAHEVRRRSLIPDGRTATAYINLLRLAMRAFTGLLPRQLDIEHALARLRRIINNLASDGERVRVWCEFAIRCFGANHKDLGTRIVREEVRTILNNIADRGFRGDVLVDAAPALYCAHATSAVRELEALDEQRRGGAFEAICRYILTKQPAGEPVSWEYRQARLTAQDVDDLLECLTYVDRDTAVSYCVEKLTDAAMAADGASEFTRARKNDIARRIAAISDQKLPWSHGIKHNGYRIVLASCVHALQASPRAAWRELTTQAGTIANVADRAYVLGIIAAHAPAKINDLRSETIRSASDWALKIPAPLDRMERLRFLGRIAISFDITAAKACIEQAFRLTISAKSDVSAQQRSIIDIANRVSDEFARSLIALLDDDPVLVRRKRLRRRNNILEVLKKLPKELSDSTLSELTPHETAELCGLMLEGLHDGSVAFIAAGRAHLFVERVEQVGLREAYPVLSWAAENAVAAHATTPYGTKYMVEMFDACADACELAIRVMSRSSGYQAGVTESVSSSFDAGGETIEPGQRERALQIIADWIRSHNPEVLKVCDPYFGPADLDILKLILEVVPNCKVQILAGGKKQRDLQLQPPYDDVYAREWKRLSKHNPPQTDLIFAELVENGDCPIHERWVLSRGQGLKLGSSFSGLGRHRVCEITALPDAVAAANEGLLDQYLNCRVRDNRGDRVRYFTSSLG
jgi:hypothetical protein